MFQLAVRIWTENGMIYPAKFSVLYDVYKKESHVRAFIKNDKIVSDEYMLITPFSASDGPIFEKDIIVVDDNEAMRVVEFNMESGSYQAINIKDNKDIIVMTSKHTYETAGNVFEDTDIVEGTKYAVQAVPKPDVKKEVEEVKKDEKAEPAVKTEPVKENPDKKNVQRNEQNQGNQNQQNQNNQQQQNNNQEQGNPNKRNKKNKKNKQDRQDNRDKSDNRQQPNAQNNQSNQQNQQKNNQDKPKDTRPEQKEATLPKEPPVREEKKPLPTNVKEEPKEKAPEIKVEQPEELKEVTEAVKPAKAEPVKNDVSDSKQESVIPTVKEDVPMKEESVPIKKPEVNKAEEPKAKAEIKEEVKESLLKENHDGQMSFITEPDESDYFDEPKKKKEEESALKNTAEKPVKAELYFTSECPSRNGSYVFSVLSRGMEETFFGEEENTDSKKIALQGLIDSLSSFDGSFNITIFTDSQYVVYPFIKGWINKWKNSNWFKNDTDRIQNFELWSQLLELSNKYNVKWEFVAQPTEQMIKCKNILKVNKS